MKQQCGDIKIPKFERNYTTEEIPIDRLFVDHTYQRDLTGYEKVIVSNFDSDLLLPLCVSERPGATSAKVCYAVIDGQTRLEALKMIGHKGTVPCNVYRGYKVYEEAALFEAFQLKR